MTHEPLAPITITRLAFRGYLQSLIEEIVAQYRLGQLGNAAKHNFARQIETAAFKMVMNRKEAARFLGISVRTLDRWVKYDGLPSDFRQIKKGSRPQRIFLLADTLDWQLRRIDRYWKPRRKP